MTPRPWSRFAGKEINSLRPVITYGSRRLTNRWTSRQQSKPISKISTTLLGERNSVRSVPATPIDHDAKRQGLAIREFPQTVPYTTAMGQALFDLLTGKNLLLYPSGDIRAQALNTITIETPRGWRIAKEKTTKKIDVIVALAMACVSTMTIGKREPVRVW